MSNGANIRRLTSEKTISKSRAINGFLERLSRGQITVEQFIERSKNVISRFTNESLAINQGNGNDSAEDTSN